MSARAARRLLDRARKGGGIVSTLGPDSLQVWGEISAELRTEIAANFRPVFELVAAREDAEASELIARAASRFGWGRDDCESALASVERDARRGLHWLRRFAEGLGPPGLVPDLKPATRAARAPKKEPAR